MNDWSSLPPELQHLIEKREQSERRKGERRQDEEPRQLDLGPLGALQSPDELADEFPPERREEIERRGQDRRHETRRQEDT